MLLAASAGAAANLITNGTFDGAKGTGSLGGWKGSGGTLTLVTGNGGGHGAQITVSGAPKQVYAYTSAKPVKNAAAGATYALNGQVTSVVPGQTVCLILKELKGATATARQTQQQCITPTSAWQSFPAVSLTVSTAGDSLTVNVQEKPVVSGATFTIDNISLTAGTPPPPDTTPPTVPQNVSASADSPTLVTVSWSGSTDDTGVAGYHVYRSDISGPIATLGSSARSYNDDTVQASTPYSYTVDAFDAVPNTSAQSSPPATVTTPDAPPSPCGGLAYPASPPVYQHVVVIMDENINYADWRGSAQAPYTNLLASQCASAGQFLALTHPSQPNYLGAADGMLDAWTGSAQSSGYDNLYHQIGLTGGALTWKVLNESMTSNCQSKDAAPYAKRHNPAVWFTDLGAAPNGDGSCATQDVPFSLSTFSPSMLGSFTWIVPNLCNDMHWQSGCAGSSADAVPNGDTWLSQFLPEIFSSADYQAGNTIVLFTFDEGEGSKGGGGGAGTNCLAAPNPETAGCHIGFVAMSEYITPGSTDTRTLSVYNLLASMETMWGLPLLGNAQTAALLGQTYGF